MSTVSKARPPKRPEPDPYRYGWRYVRIVAPDGTETFDQVPLTLEDVLFPKTGDFIVQTDGHDSDRGYLKAVFKAQLSGDPTAAVVSDCRVDWNLAGVEPLGPDVAVFFGVKQYDDWSTFDVAAEGARSALVVEITSPETRSNDVGPKVDFYHQAKVPLYVLADASKRGGKRRLKLIGYRFTRRGYRRMALDAQGRIYLKPVRLCLGVTLDRQAGYERLACYDPETGKELGDYTAVVAALAEAEARVRAANQEARAAKRRARAAVKRAAAESQARAQAEALIRELQAELKRSRGPGP